MRQQGEQTRKDWDKKRVYTINLLLMAALVPLLPTGSFGILKYLVTGIH